MENKYLLNLFTLEKSLVYYLNATNSNTYAIERLKHASDKIGFSQRSAEFLDDIIIENHQCARQAEIYSNILAGLMDARASIVSNNLNVMMKNLNAVVIAVAVPSFFAGVGGMSELCTVTGISDPRLAFLAFVTAMGMLGLITYWIIKRLEKH
jgi:magnesium transporter